MEGLSSSMQRLVESVRSSAIARHAALDEMRRTTRAVLQEYHRGRRQTALAARQNTRNQVGEIRRAAVELRRSTRSALGAIASDTMAATGLWSGQLKVGVFHAPPAPVAAEQPPAGEESRPQAELPKDPQPAAAASRKAAPTAERTEKERVLQIIRAHRDGIRLVDVGNEMGVNWRGLIGVTKSLLEEGNIEKIDSLYYSVAD